MPGRAVGKSVGGLGIGDHQYHGLIKVRLAHRENGSLLVPDQVYLESPTVWFQPNTFLPCILGQLDDEIRARLWVNVEGGHTLGVDRGVRVLERLGSMLPISRSFEHLENKS